MFRKPLEQPCLETRHPEATSLGEKDKKQKIASVPLKKVPSVSALPARNLGTATHYTMRHSELWGRGSGPLDAIHPSISGEGLELPAVPGISSKTPHGHHSPRSRTTCSVCRLSQTAEPERCRQVSTRPFFFSPRSNHVRDTKEKRRKKKERKQIKQGRDAHKRTTQTTKRDRRFRVFPTPLSSLGVELSFFFSFVLIFLA